MFVGFLGRSNSIATKYVDNNLRSATVVARSPGRMTDETLLPPNVLRLISDKLYEKRKLAALEIEQLVKKLSAAGDHGRVRLLVDKVGVSKATELSSGLTVVFYPETWCQNVDWNVLFHWPCTI